MHHDLRLGGNQWSQNVDGSSGFKWIQVERGVQHGAAMALDSLDTP